MIVGNRNKVLISTPNGKSLNIAREHSPGSNSENGSDEDDSSKKNGSKTKGKISEYEEKIRVGKDFQAVCPDMAAEKRLEMVGNDRALLVWSPTKDIPDSKLEEYISVAKEKYGYNGEQALGMLFWHKHDLERAVLDLANFTPFPDEWTVEDKVLFEQAFQFHGKSFHRIRQMLPDKTIASLVKYYYSWKKTRSRTSAMDRQEKKKMEGGSENGSENGSNEDSDSEEKKCLHRGIRRASRSPNNNKHSIPNITNSNDNSITTFPTNQTHKNGSNSLNVKQDVAKDGLNENNKDTGYSSSSSSTSGQQPNCTNCNVLCNELKGTSAGSFCYSCHHHWRRTGDLRPTSGPNFLGNKANKRPHSKTGQLYYYHGYHDGSSKTKCKPPKGMYINHDDVVQLATQSKLAIPSSNTENRNNDLLASMDREIVSLWSHIQTNKQKISWLKKENVEHVEDKEAKDQYNLYNRINARWASDELLLAVKGVRKYGKKWQAIAEMLGTKTDSQVRQFFTTYRRQYNLDKVLKEYEADDTNKSDINIVLKIDLEEETNGMNGSEDITNIDEIIGVAKGRSSQGRTNLDKSVIYVDDVEENNGIEKMDVTEESDEPTQKRYSITEPIQTEGARVARETKASAAAKPAVSAKVAITTVSKEKENDVEMEVDLKETEESKSSVEIKEVKLPEVTSLPSTPVTTTLPITT